MSPEQLRGDAIDFRSDIYSMGCILYHMLVGHPPFEASESNVVSVIYQHLEKEPTPPSEIEPDISPRVEQVILRRAAAKAPDDRYATVEAMADALNEALGRRLSTTSYPIVHVDSKPRPASTPCSADARAACRCGGAALVAGLLVADPGGAGAACPRANDADARRRRLSSNDETDVAAAFRADADEIASAQARLGDRRLYRLRHLQPDQPVSRGAGARDRRYGGAVRAARRAFTTATTIKQPEISQIERARADGVTGLIVCPLDVETLDDTLTSVAAGGDAAGHADLEQPRATAAC